MNLTMKDEKIKLFEIVEDMSLKRLITITPDNFIANYSDDYRVNPIQHALLKKWYLGVQYMILKIKTSNITKYQSEEFYKIIFEYKIEEDTMKFLELFMRLKLQTTSECYERILYRSIGKDRRRLMDKLQNRENIKKIVNV